MTNGLARSEAKNVRSTPPPKLNPRLRMKFSISISPHATELLAEACVAMALESTADELGRIMHAHPTVSESVMEAAEGVHDLTIHL